MIKDERNGFSLSHILNLFIAALSISTVTCSNNYYNVKCRANHFKPL